MKKITYLIGAMALVFCAFSCQKELLEGNSGEAFAEEGTPVSLTVNNNLWTANGKSAVVPGEGVKVLGNELMGLVYIDTDGVTIKGASDAKPIQAKPDGAGKYTFTAPTGSLEQKYVAMVPQLRSGNALDNSTKPYHTISVKVSPIQYPTATSFDPACDVLISEPFSITSTESGAEATINSFKRMTAPLKLKISGLDDADKIYAVSFKVEGQATSAASSLISYAMYNIGENYDDVKVYASKQANTVENGVSAVYPAGLAKDGANWPVWFSVNPLNIKSGSTITVSVQTANKEYTRSVVLSAAKQLSSEQINELGFNVKGDGFTEKNAIYQDFLTDSPAYSTSVSSYEYTASDGNAYTWKIGAARRWAPQANDNTVVLKKCMEFWPKDGGSIEIPTISGKYIQKVRVYLHHNCTIANAQLPFAIYDGDTKLSDVTVNMTTSCTGYSAGYVDITLPEGKDNFGGLKFVSNDATYATYNYILISGIAMYYVSDPSHVDPVTLNLSFTNGTSFTWPFSETNDLNGTAKHLGETMTYTKSGTSYKFEVLGTGGLVVNSAAGFGFGKAVDDYIKFPAIPGLRLTKVTLENGFATHMGRPSIFDADGLEEIRPWQYASTTTTVAKGEILEYYLTDTEVNTSYRLAMTAADVWMYIRNITLNYEQESAYDKVVEANLVGGTGYSLDWPFTTPAKTDLGSGTGTATKKGERTAFITSDATYYVYGTDGLFYHQGTTGTPTAGVCFGRAVGDYIELPAYEGLKLAKVEVECGMSFGAQPHIVDVEGTEVSGGASITAGTKGSTGT